MSRAVTIESTRGQPRILLRAVSVRWFLRSSVVITALWCLASLVGCNTTEEANAGRKETSPNAPDYFHGCVQLKDVPLGVVCDGRVVFNLCSTEGLCESRVTAAAFLVTAQTSPKHMSQSLVSLPARTYKETPVYRQAIQNAEGEPVVVVERIKGPEGQMFKNGICSRPALERFAARCDQLLGAVIENKLTLMAFRNVEATIAKENIPLTVAERPFKTPADCTDIEVERGDLTMGIEAPIKGARLACSKANLRWMTTPTLKSAIAMLHTPMPGSGMANSRVGCELEGVPTNCASWRGTADGPKPNARLLEGFVKVRERVLFARCEWIAPNGDSDQVPAPCDQIFRLPVADGEK